MASHMTGATETPAVDLAKLKRLAEAADGDAWRLRHGLPMDVEIDGGQWDGAAVLEDGNVYYAAFIAASNPATVLALIARVEALEGALSKISVLVGTYGPPKKREINDLIRQTLNGAPNVQS